LTSNSSGESTELNSSTASSRKRASKQTRQEHRRFDPSSHHFADVHAAKVHGLLPGDAPVARPAHHEPRHGAQRALPHGGQLRHRWLRVVPLQVKPGSDRGGGGGTFLLKQPAPGRRVVHEAVVGGPRRRRPDVGPDAAGAGRGRGGPVGVAAGAPVRGGRGKLDAAAAAVAVGNRQAAAAVGLGGPCCGGGRLALGLFHPGSAVHGAAHVRLKPSAFRWGGGCGCGGGGGRRAPDQRPRGREALAPLFRVCGDVQALHAPAKVRVWAQDARLRAGGQGALREKPGGGGHGRNTALAVLLRRASGATATEAAGLDVGVRARGAPVGKAEGGRCLAGTAAAATLVGSGRAGLVALEADGQLLAAVEHPFDLYVEQKEEETKCGGKEGRELREGGRDHRAMSVSNASKRDQSLKALAAT